MCGRGRMRSTSGGVVAAVDDAAWSDVVIVADRIEMNSQKINNFKVKNPPT